MSNRRYLIVNADDFGMRESSDRAIAALFRQGAITSTTVLSPAARAAQACRAARDGGFPVGVHWTLHSEWADAPWMACAGASTLTDGAGRLLPDCKRASSGDVTRELEAQINFMERHGVRPDHADSHGGTLYGINGRLFFVNAFRLCRAYRLPFRFAKSDGFLRRQFDGAVPGVVKGAQRFVAGLARKMGVSILDDFVTNPYPAEKAGGYEALCAYYEAELAKAPAGVTEVFLHPSLPDAEMSARTPEWAKREWEYQFLAEGRLARAAEKEGFELVSWAVFGSAL